MEERYRTRRNWRLYRGNEWCCRRQARRSRNRHRAEDDTGLASTLYDIWGGEVVIGLEDCSLDFRRFWRSSNAASRSPLVRSRLTNTVDRMVVSRLFRKTSALSRIVLAVVSSGKLTSTGWTLPFFWSLPSRFVVMVEVRGIFQNSNKSWCTRWSSLCWSDGWRPLITMFFLFLSLLIRSTWTILKMSSMFDLEDSLRATTSAHVPDDFPDTDPSIEFGLVGTRPSILPGPDLDADCSWEVADNGSLTALLRVETSSCNVALNDLSFVTSPLRYEQVILKFANGSSQWCATLWTLPTDDLQEVFQDPIKHGSNSETRNMSGYIAVAAT